MIHTRCCSAGRPPHLVPGAAPAAPREALRGVLAALLLVAALAAAPAEGAIYRTVDENGNVVFTDVPPRDGQPGETVELGSSSSYSPPPAPTPPAGAGGTSLEDWLEGRSGAEEEVEGAGAAPVSYTSLRITSPADDAALRENAGNVVVSTALDPSLAAGHLMQVWVDGEMRQQGHATTFQLVNLDRGTHNLQVRVIDATGNTVIASEPSVFHLQRRSVILQPNNRAR